jgi:pyruvate kinase
MEAGGPRRTKIIATLGPATASKEAIFRLAEAGMDGARLNFSHGTHDQHAASAALVREVQAELNRPLALIADLQGPKLRVGELEAPVTLTGGDEVIVAG